MMAKATPKATPKKDRHALFLSSLAEYGNVSKAADLARLDRATLYRKRGEDEAFSAEWDKALAIGVEALEDEAKRRAYEGWDEPVFHEGIVCGAKRKFSDTLLIVLLKAHKPEKYMDRQKVDNTSSDGSMTPKQHIDLGDRSIDELMALGKALRGQE